ncbi:MAG: response regulator [Candidatus Omnitrophota bacterium]|nr:response regulator [Candidatus Omnitrophota bacterium]
MTKILLVDDEKDICDFIARFFGERNFEVICAMNGANAVLFMKKDRPDIVLLDIKMKDMDGIEILKRIKDVNRAAAVVMVSCIDDTDTMNKARALGAAAYLTKPIALKELLEVVMKNTAKRNRLFGFGKMPKDDAQHA